MSVSGAAGAIDMTTRSALHSAIASFFEKPGPGGWSEYRHVRATGALKQGRYLKYAQNNPNPWSRNYRNAYVGAPHNRVLVHLCKAMGMDIDFIHKPSIDGTFPVRKTISMSGSLPRLTG